MNSRKFNFTRLELSLDKCLGNFRYFKDKLEPSTKMLVLVKANAYGHGAVEVASMMQRAGADYLAVALPVEGVELRGAGISLPILVLTCGGPKASLYQPFVSLTFLRINPFGRRQYSS